MPPSRPSRSIASKTLSMLCAGSPMPMKTTFFTGGAPAERHLRDDLGTAELAQEAVLAGHAEGAADGAADLGRDAEAVARQQHAFDHLAVGERDEQARRAVFACMFGTHLREGIEFGPQRRQVLTHGERQVVLGRPRPAVERLRDQPGAQHAFLVAGFGAERAQALADGFDAHGVSVRRAANGVSGDDSCQAAVRRQSEVFSATRARCSGSLVSIALPWRGRVSWR